MKAKIMLIFAVGALAASWAAGYTALAAYLITGGSSIWDGMISKCQEFETNRGVVRGLDCVKNGVVYLVGAAAAFGGGYARAEYIKNQGVTNVGTRSVVSHREWDWSAIEARPEAFVNEISKTLPGKYHGHAFNLTGHGIHNPVAVMNMHGDNMYAHVSNLTHGTVYMGTHPVETGLAARAGRWDFAGWGGMKYSYSNPGCQPYDFSYQTETANLNSEAWNFVNWANSGNKGAKYSLQWEDDNRYGTPYVAGYYIIEVNGFGTNYEGSPQVNECER